MRRLAYLKLTLCGKFVVGHLRSMIGEQMGTGGSSGVQYLKDTLEQRLLPELRAARQPNQMQLG